MKKRNILITALSVALAVSASVFTVFGGFTKNSPSVQAKENDNAYWEQYFDVESENAVSFNSTASLPSYMSHITTQVDGVNKTVGTGLGVTFSSPTTLTYKNPVLTSQLTSKTALFEYLVAPVVKSSKPSGQASEASDSEFSRVLIRIEGYDDPSKFVEIQHFRSSHDASLSWARVASHTADFAGVKKGQTDKTVDKGTPVNTSFTGLQSKASTFYFDNETSTVYTAYPLYNELSYGAPTGTVRSFINPNNLLGSDSIFAGFTSDYVRLSITFDQLYVEGNDAHVVLTKVLGQPLESADFNDKVAPVIALPLEYNLTNIPEGEQNTYYPLWDVAGYDVVDGIISDDINFEVEYLGTNGLATPTQVATNGFGFTPTNVGFYQVTFTLTDNAGNHAENLVVPVKVLPIVETIALNFAGGATLPKTASVGQKVTIPEYAITGGSGILDIDFSVTYNNRTVDVPVENGAFYIENAGVYNVTFVVVDYLGDYRVFDYAISTELSAKPIIDDVVIPKNYKKGSVIQLNLPKAYDYASFPGVKTEVPVTMHVATDTQATYQELAQNEAGEYLFAPDADATEIRVKYTAVTKITGVEVVEEKVIKLIEAINPIDFWVYDDTKIERNIEEVVGGEEYVYTIKEEGAELSYLIPVQSDLFSLALNFAAYTANFEKITITLRDSANANEIVTLSLSPRNDETVFLSTPHINYANTVGQMNNLAADSSVFFRFKLGKQIVDNVGTIILNLGNFDNGEVFNGFSSGKAYVSIKFNEMKQGDGIVNKVRLGRFYAQYAYEEDSTDFDGPSIDTERHISTYYSYLDEVVLPKANAYDLYCPYNEVYLVVRDPDGNLVIDNVLANKEHSFVLTKNGRYVVEYYSYDEYDNITNISFNLFTLDVVDPVIEIDGQIKTSVKVGEALDLPDYYVTDNFSTPEDILRYVYLETPTFGYKTIAIGDKVGTYKFQVAGEYKLVYFAMDKASNYTYKTFTITVTD